MAGQWPTLGAVGQALGVFRTPSNRGVTGKTADTNLLFRLASWDMVTLVALYDPVTAIEVRKSISSLHKLLRYSRIPLINAILPQDKDNVHKKSCHVNLIKRDGMLFKLIEFPRQIGGGSRLCECASTSSGTISCNNFDDVYAFSLYHYVVTLSFTSQLSLRNATHFSPIIDPWRCVLYSDTRRTH